MKPLHLRDVVVERVVESEGKGFYPSFLLPECSRDVIESSKWLQPHFYDRDTGRFIQSVHSFVVRTKRHVVLVDTCVGNDKERPSSRAWHRQATGWLDDLAAIGLTPGDIDFVLCTHLHVDHVGWNTRLVNGQWVPTFPNARYLFHEREYAYWEAEREMPVEIGYGRTEGSFEDSVLPVVEAGLMHMVSDQYEIDDQLWIEATPGHSPGHVCLHVGPSATPEQSMAVFTGDLMHHPIQCAHPQWNSRYCYDAEQSRETRERVVERYTDRDTLILAAHFATPTAGRIIGASNGVRQFSVCT